MAGTVRLVLILVTAIALSGCAPAVQMPPFVGFNFVPPPPAGVLAGVYPNPSDEAQLLETIAELRPRCTDRVNDLARGAAAAQDEAVSTKGIIGAITGGLTTIGSLIAASVEVDQPPVGEDADNPATGWAIGTAVVAALGGIVVLAVTPGSETVALNRQAIDDINGLITDMNQVSAKSTDPAGWNATDRTTWTGAVSVLDNECP